MRVQARCRDFWEKVLPPLLRQKVAERNDSVSRRRGRRGSRLLSSARIVCLLRTLGSTAFALRFCTSFFRPWLQFPYMDGARDSRSCDQLLRPPPPLPRSYVVVVWVCIPVRLV